MPLGAHPEMTLPSRGRLPTVGIGHPATRTAIDCPRLYPRKRTNLGRQRPIRDLANRSRPRGLPRAHVADSASVPGTPRKCAPRVNHGWEWLPMPFGEMSQSPRNSTDHLLRASSWPFPVWHPDRSTCALVLLPWSLTRIAYRHPTRSETHPMVRQWKLPVAYLLRPARASICMSPACNTTAVRFRRIARHTTQSDHQATVVAGSPSLVWRHFQRSAYAKSKGAAHTASLSQF